MTDCDHGLGPVTGTHHGYVICYSRPVWRLFRKTYWRRCWYCDYRERVEARAPREPEAYSLADARKHQSYY
jgi:hypothetical protein